MLLSSRLNPHIELLRIPLFKLHSATVSCFVLSEPSKLLEHRARTLQKIWFSRKWQGRSLEQDRSLTSTLLPKHWNMNGTRDWLDERQVPLPCGVRALMVPVTVTSILRTTLLMHCPCVPSKTRALHRVEMNRRHDRHKPSIAMKTQRQVHGQHA